jgi:hypothetical protein
MNFMDIETLAECLEEHFPAGVEQSGSHIWVKVFDDVEFTIWMASDDEAVIEDTPVSVDRGHETIYGFALLIAEAIQSHLADLDNGDTSANEVEAEAEVLASEDFFAESIAINDRIKALATKMEPLKERFYTFLKEANPATYLTYSELTAPSSEFALDFSTITKEGFIFTTNETDWDEEEMFFMPSAYMDNPELWEKKLKEQIFNDRSLVLKAFKSTEILQQYSVGKIVLGSEEGAPVFIVEGIAESKGETESSTTLFVIQSADGLVYRAGDYFNRIAVEAGLVEPVGKFSV